MAGLPRGRLEPKMSTRSTRKALRARSICGRSSNRPRPPSRLYLMRRSTWNHKSVLQPILRDAAKRPLLRVRSNLLKHNNLMLRSEQRERLEAWAASDQPISHGQYQAHRLRFRQLLEGGGGSAFSGLFRPIKPHGIVDQQLALQFGRGCDVPDEIHQQA